MYCTRCKVLLILGKRAAAEANCYQGQVRDGEYQLAEEVVHKWRVMRNNVAKGQLEEH